MVAARLRAELWASAEPGPAGPRKPLLARPGEVPLAAVGGLELRVGLELAVWCGAGRKMRERTGPKRNAR